MLSAECRRLRRALRPLVWVVLEEVALDAVIEDGTLVARTSARQVAERLGVNPGTAAQALRALGQCDLVRLEREKGPAGRFGLSVYQLAPVAGLSIVHPCAANPFVVSPSMVMPPPVGPAVSSPSVALPDAESSCVDDWPPDRPGRLAVGADTDPMPVASDLDSSGVSRGDNAHCPLGRAPASPCSSGDFLGQTALDLGLGSS